jgi:hypothetical protein
MTAAALAENTAEHAAADEAITDTDRDSLHILPISILPVEIRMLKRARMIKNSRLDSVLEFFNGTGTGSGQVEMSSIPRLLGLEKGQTHPDVDVLKKVSELPSFDVYSLRILLRANNIDIKDHSVLSLSPAKIRSLSAYMATFTRPLVSEVFGHDTNVEHFTDIIGLFHGHNPDVVRDRLSKMANKLGISVTAIPKFLEDYADIFMSLSYYRECLDHILPHIQSFMDATTDIRDNYQLRHDKNLMTSLDTIEEVINSRMASITGRLESFEKSTGDMWRDLTAERFRKIETLISSYHTVIGGVLCALSVKMNAWVQLFPEPKSGGPVRRAAFVMSDMRQGIDRICALKDDDTPVLAALNS